MTNIIEHTQLIFTDTKKNSYKVWRATLYDNNDVFVEWSRVGYPQQSKMFPGKGSLFFNKKLREKIEKGYVVSEVINGTSSNTTILPDNGLQAIATSQIAKNSDPILIKLVKQLVDANVHKITNSTQLNYNPTSGLFSTPLGILTDNAISKARVYLDVVANGISIGSYDSDEFDDAVNNYLRLVPQYVGMRLDIKALFPDITAIQKQSNILDSLEASYKAAIATPLGSNNTQEQVFSVNVSAVNNSKDASRLTDWFETSKKRAHGYDHVKVINVFSVTIDDMANGFNNKLGNIKEVFHGTSQANCLSILKSGLHIAPPSTARIAGKMFGNGVYGALQSTKSLGYTYGRWGQGGVGDSGWLFVCDFAMGKYYEVNTANPYIPNGYNSIWAKAGRSLMHDELIVYNDNQVNIKYLLECK